MNEDWVKDYRSTLDWGWFTDVPTAHLWEYLRLKVNFVEGEWRGIKVKPGSVILSEDRIASETGLSRQQVRTALKKLVSTNEITKTTTSGFTMITINKWPKYQGKAEDATVEKTTYCSAYQPTEQLDSNQQSNQAPTNEQPQYKKGRREEELKKEIYKERKFSRPSIGEVVAYCKERNNSVDAQKWYDYYSSNGWKVGKNPMKDWKACVRTWERNTPKQEERKADYYEVPWLQKN